MKLSVLPLSIRAFTFNPLMSTDASDFESDVGLGTVATVGDQAAPDTLFLGCKWPFFWHLRQIALRAGHFERGCLLFPQKKQLGPSVLLQLGY